MPDLKLYTVAEIRKWLVDNHAVEGLSEQVIAPTRAWAIIHNPYVKDDDAVVAAIFDNGKLAAYTASFPEMIEGKRVWWASTLYCYPQFTGRGYGMIVIGSLIEAHEPELTYDRWGAPETVEIFNYLGFKTTYTTRYHLSNKKIDTSTLKGNLAYCAQELKKRLHPWPKQSKADYSLRYASFIDGEAYAFMRAHRGSDLWLREQEMFNWILRYPFWQRCALMNRVEKDNEFSANILLCEYVVVKVYSKNQLIGVYILRINGETLSLIYLYYCNECKNVVFTSIIDHVITLGVISFNTEKQELCDYVQTALHFPKIEEERISFSLPVCPCESELYSLQYGDGDSFV